MQLCITSAFGGVTLADYLFNFKAGNPLPEATARSIISQLASAAWYLHAVAIMHRDIKSENVLVEQLPDGQVFIRLIDFGLARVIAPLLPSVAADVLNDAQSATKPALDEDSADESSDSDSFAEFVKRHRAEDCKLMGFDTACGSSLQMPRVGAKRRVVILKPPAQPLARTNSGPRSKRSQMTRLVVTHWYRPPELFLDSNKNAAYDAKVDVWSLGCIFAEVMYRVFPPPSECSPHKFCGVLFYHEEDAATFMRIFMTLFGPPKADDIEALKRKLNATDAAVLSKLVAAAGTCRDSVDVHPVFSRMSPLARDLLRKSLHFSIDKRISAEEFFCHPYLGGTREQLVDIAGGSQQLEATLKMNQSLRLEQELMSSAHLQNLISEACRRLKGQQSQSEENARE
jgi:serine/threonine protein kinase